jgi:uncharacterized LabA/DUF88 family protein
LADGVGHALLNDLPWLPPFTTLCIHPSGYLQNRTRGGLRKEPPLHCFRPMRTWLYVDGFNLYYGAVRATPLRWLNPVVLAQQAFPANQIIRTKYFTAALPPSASDPMQAARQQAYWRALRSLGDVEIIEGHFRVRQVWAPLAQPPPPMAQIIRHEEKGSDINLAAHLMADGFGGEYQAAIVISGDSDFTTPVRMVREKVGRPVGVLNPQRISGPGSRSVRNSGGLRRAASFYQNGVSWSQLERAQFPAMIYDVAGIIHRPPEWAPPSAP